MPGRQQSPSPLQRFTRMRLPLFGARGPSWERCGSSWRSWASGWAGRATFSGRAPGCSLLFQNWGAAGMGRYRAVQLTPGTLGAHKPGPIFIAPGCFLSLPRPGCCPSSSRWRSQRAGGGPCKTSSLGTLPLPPLAAAAAAGGSAAPGKSVRKLGSPPATPGHPDLPERGRGSWSLVFRSEWGVGDIRQGGRDAALH